MQHFSQSSTRRSITWVVLAVWLFAWASGVANACLLQDRATHQHANQDRMSGAETPHLVSAGHAGAVADHASAGDMPSGLCLKTCDQGSYSPVKHQTPLDGGDPGPAPLHATVWATTPPALPAFDGQTDRQRGTLALPIRTRYVRLAL